mmetsp:Transcript_6473/g.15635  ORF Transcript_6473/g.15635 Transcript_6473/m.15635 type:complete len:201 (+) Transcript_6473:896-1498(+)
MISASDGAQARSIWPSSDGTPSHWYADAQWPLENAVMRCRTCVALSEGWPGRCRKRFNLRCWCTSACAFSSECACSIHCATDTLARAAGPAGAEFIFGAKRVPPLNGVAALVDVGNPSAASSAMRRWFSSSIEFKGRKSVAESHLRKLSRHISIAPLSTQRRARTFTARSSINDPSSSCLSPELGMYIARWYLVAEPSTV